MQVATSFEQIACSGPVLLTIGTFDGVHRGHQFLLQQARDRAREHGYHLVIVTFDPSPSVVLRPDVGRYQLTTARQKVRLLEALSPALVVLLPFTRDLAALSADGFLDALEGRLELRELWMGEDFHFGRDRQGGLAMLVRRGQQDGFSVHVVARRMEARTSISSTRARDALLAGDVAGVMPLLGRPYALDLSSEQVVDDEVGPPPSLWLRVAPHLVLPADGTYAVLLGAESGAGVPGVAVVSARAPYRHLRVLALTRNALPVAMEFIAQLTGGRAEHDARAIAEARAVVAGWHRPRFEAAGDY